MKTGNIILLVCIVLLIVIVAVVVFAITAHKKTMNKLNENIFNLLSDLISDQEAKVEKTTAYGFQYKIIEKNRITYVCTIYNPKCSEILINSKIKWQIKENPTDDSLVFIDNIVKPMMSEIKDDKEVKKLFIILAVIFRGDGFNRRGKHTARAAPGRPEINQNRLAVREYLSKIFVRGYLFHNQ